MKRRSALEHLALAGAVSFLPKWLPAAEKQAPTFRSDVRLVLLDVSVKNRAGRFVPGLARENFGVLENGVPQPITVFANADLPVTIGILVDGSRSMLPKRGQVLAAAETFIRESNPQDEIFVLHFSDIVTPGLLSPELFSSDREKLRGALYRFLPQGRTSLNDAIITGLRHLELGRRDKKTLVVISDGGDNASHHSRKQMILKMESSIATVYAIGLFNAGDPERDPGVLREISRISGGEVYFPASLPEMDPLCSAIAKDIRTRYTIGYHPPAANGVKPLRHIRVRVSAPGARLVARTRTSYRYDDTP